MDRRLKLHEELCEILETTYVYFQPPESIKMSYPCVRYSRADIDHRRANNALYTNTDKYEITVIDYDPDSEIPKKILSHFPMCSFDRGYVANNLNHTVLTLYY